MKLRNKLSELKSRKICLYEGWHGALFFKSQFFILAILLIILDLEMGAIAHGSRRHTLSHKTIASNVLTLDDWSIMSEPEFRGDAACGDIIFPEGSVVTYKEAKKQFRYMSTHRQDYWVIEMGGDVIVCSRDTLEDFLEQAECRGTKYIPLFMCMDSKVIMF